MPKTSEASMELSKCRLCCRPHSLRYCKAFLAMTPAERHESARVHKYCVNCLATSHVTGACDSPASCHQCGRAHHTLLHRTLAKSSTIRRRERTRYASRRTIRRTRGLQSPTAARSRKMRELLKKAQDIINQLKELVSASTRPAGRDVEDMDDDE
ncbi:uncharacterized protein LOC118738812 [Rhagoletis pomonella]|uniref:uncharacterized protein LOC118738812 n=1 Tax=Rhagoletis pomonella TaxID=28610 RepID=UPI00177B10B2|nr:uncharacterized protein LOC118738812 [Rhagoletis pomonella]